MRIDSAKAEMLKPGYVLMFFLFTAGAFYGLNKYPPFLDFDSVTMSIFINNLSYNNSYDFGFKNVSVTNIFSSDNFFSMTKQVQDVYRQYWAAHFLPTSIPLSIIQTLFSISAFKVDTYLKIVSLAIGILGCFFASLLLPSGEAKPKGARLFLIFVSLYAPISFLYFRTAVVNMMMSFMLFWAAIYIFYLFVHTEKNKYLYILSVVLAYYGKNPYVHILFLPPIFLGFIFYKKLFLKLVRNKHVYLSAVLMIILYTGITFILANKYDNSYDSFTQKTDAFVKIRGGFSSDNLKLNLLPDKMSKYINQHVSPRHDMLGDWTRDDRLWTFNDIHGPWQVLYALFVIGVFISIFGSRIDDVTVLFLVITISIVLVCFIVSFPEGRYMLPLVPCYSFFMLKTIDFTCSKLNVRMNFNSFIYFLIMIVLSLYTYSLLTGSYNKYSLKQYQHLYGIKQGIEYIQNDDRSGNPQLYVAGLARATNSTWAGYETLLYTRLYSNFKVTLADNGLWNVLNRIDKKGGRAVPNIYFLEKKSALPNLTQEGFLPVYLPEKGSTSPNLRREFLFKRIIEYQDEYSDEPMCLLKLDLE